MKTAHKIALARTAYRAVNLARSSIGLTDRCTVQRRGITFDLDLSQGVDFALFLDRYERSTQDALGRLVVPGSAVLDVGANIGAMTLLLAKLVGPTGRVLAFEPTDYAFAKQQKNLSLNPDLAGRVTSYHCFLSAEDDSDVPTDIYSAWPLTGGERLHTKHLGQPMPTAAARSRKLDTVLREAGVDRVQLVKLDVDGFEVDVLRGAPELLKTKPVFVMELAPYCLDEHGSSLDEMLSFFRENGYSIHTETGRPLPQSSGELLKIIGDGSSLNVVAS